MWVLLLVLLLPVPGMLPTDPPKGFHTQSYFLEKYTSLAECVSEGERISAEMVKEYGSEGFELECKKMKQQV